MTKQQIICDYQTLKRQISEEYKTKKRLLKEEYAARKRQYFDERESARVAPVPKRTVLEEIGNAVTHGVGAIFAVISYMVMLFGAKTPMHAVAATVYFVGMFTMFCMSCLYHAFRYGTTVKRVFRRFDYASIYLLIGGTFAPILLLLGIDNGLLFFGAQWLIIAAGITIVAVFGPGKLRGLHTALYLALGWSALLFLPQMLAQGALFWWVLGGGIIYSLGIIPFALKKKSCHFIWHFFVLAGAIVQWIGIFVAFYV